MGLENKINSTSKNRPLKVLTSAAIGGTSAYFMTKYSIENLPEIINFMSEDLSREVPLKLYNTLEKGKDFLSKCAIGTGALSWAGLGVYLTRDKTPEFNVDKMRQEGRYNEEILKGFEEFNNVDGHIMGTFHSWGEVGMYTLKATSMCTAGGVVGYHLFEMLSQQPFLVGFPSVVKPLIPIGGTCMGIGAGKKFTDHIHFKNK